MKSSGSPSDHYCATVRVAILLLAGLAAGSLPTLAAAPAPDAAAPPGDVARCVAGAALDLQRLLAPPPAQGSADTRAELDELLQLQATRTPAQVERARGDAELSVARFADALGNPAPLTDAAAPRTTQLLRDAAAAELAVVGPAKDRFARPRPYVVDTRLEPVVPRPTSAAYPSGHAAWAYTVGLVLADMVPERRSQILARAQEFARNRSLAGVHYPSDVLAGEIAGTAIAASLFACPAFQAEEAAATPELRKALGLPALQPPQ